jgi:hypothetical protein
VPADHRLRLENFKCVQYSRSHTIERSKDKAVNVTERQPLWGFAPQHVELMSKDKDLGLQRSPHRNGPIKAHQINLQRSLIGSEYQPIRGGRSAVLGLR